MIFGFTFVEAVAVIASLPLSYLALWIADRIRPIDVSRRRRLLLVVLSMVLVTPLELLSLWFLPLIVCINLVLVRWVYCEAWEPTALRLLIWYALSVAFAFVFGVVLSIVLALAAPHLLPA